MTDKVKDIRKVYSEFKDIRRKTKDSGSDYGQFYRKEEQSINKPITPWHEGIGLSNSFMKTSKKKNKKYGETDLLK